MSDDWSNFFERLNEPCEPASEVFTLETLLRGVDAIRASQPEPTVLVMSPEDERWYRRLLAIERRRVATREAFRAAGRLRDGR